MTDRVKEQLSACLDGELPESELDLLLKQVGRDAKLGASMGRYALIGETLRARRAVAASANFSHRVSAAIAAEPPLAGRLTGRRESRAAHWLRPAAGFAVAAGVAAVAILALQEPQPAGAPYVAEAVSDVSVAQMDVPESASYIVPASTASSSLVPAARLTNYVVAHSEYSSPLGRRSVLSGVLAEEETNEDEILDRAMDARESEVTDVDSQP
jgi:sigma-E factor negative regulatory protein RseA